MAGGQGLSHVSLCFNYQEKTMKTSPGNSWLMIRRQLLTCQKVTSGEHFELTQFFCSQPALKNFSAFDISGV